MRWNFLHIQFHIWYGEIKRFIRDDGTVKVSRSIRELNTKIKELEKHYLAKEGREITIEEIAKELKVTKEDIALAMESVAPVESIEKNIFGDEENKLSLIDKISTGKNEEEIITNKIVVKELINKLDKKEKEEYYFVVFSKKILVSILKLQGKWNKILS